jgi:hypothetical protein
MRRSGSGSFAMQLWQAVLRASGAPLPHAAARGAIAAAAYASSAPAATGSAEAATHHRAAARAAWTVLPRARAPEPPADGGPASLEAKARRRAERIRACGSVAEMEPHLWRSAGRHADAWIVSSALFRASNLRGDPGAAGLAARLKKRVTMCAASMDPAEAAYCLCALAKLGLRNEVGQRRLAARAAAHAHQLPTPLLSSLAWSTAVAVPGHYDVLNAVAEALLARRAELEPRHISTLAWAFARAGQRKVALFAALQRRALQQLEAFEPSGLAVLLWSSARLLHASEPLFQAAGRRAAAQVGRYDAPALANMAWAFAKAGVFPPAFFAAALPAFAASSGEVGGHQLCRLLWALAEFQRHQAAVQLAQASVADVLAGSAAGRQQGQQGQEQGQEQVDARPLLLRLEQRVCSSAGQLDLSSLTLAALSLSSLGDSSSPALQAITAVIKSQLQQPGRPPGQQRRPRQQGQQQEQAGAGLEDEDEGRVRPGADYVWRGIRRAVRSRGTCSCALNACAAWNVERPLCMRAAAPAASIHRQGRAASAAAAVQPPGLPGLWRHP